MSFRELHGSWYKSDGGIIFEVSIYGAMRMIYILVCVYLFDISTNARICLSRKMVHTWCKYKRIIERFVNKHLCFQCQWYFEGLCE